MSDKGRALVLGGGGVAGIAWLTGVLAGLADAGADVTGADLLLGTSAGSAVAAQLGGGLSLKELLARQVDPALQNRELVPEGVSVAEVMRTWMRLAGEHADPEEMRRALGARALAARTVSEAERRSVIEGRLPVHAWPERDLRVTAVNALTGELRVFDRASGVGLVDAVAASCAVPMIWPAVTIGGVRYVDGGVHSANNAHLAAGHGRVLVLAPLEDPSLEVDVAEIERGGGSVEVIRPDEASLAAAGEDPLDPATRTPSAGAGFAQGQAAARAIAAFWD